MRETSIYLNRKLYSIWKYLERVVNKRHIAKMVESVASRNGVKGGCVICVGAAVFSF